MRKTIVPLVTALLISAGPASAQSFLGKDATAWYNRSLVHRKKGNIAQADADLARAKELDPKAVRN